MFTYFINTLLKYIVQIATLTYPMSLSPVKVCMHHVSTSRYQVGAGEEGVGCHMCLVFILCVGNCFLHVRVVFMKCGHRQDMLWASILPSRSTFCVREEERRQCACTPVCSWPIFHVFCSLLGNVETTGGGTDAAGSVFRVGGKEEGEVANTHSSLFFLCVPLIVR
jgi:hypothetical protein